MVRGAAHPVKPKIWVKAQRARGFAAALGLPQTPPMQAFFPIALVLTAAAAFAAWQILTRSRRRQRAVTSLLDAADALEARLRAARSEIEAIAGDCRNPVRTAMQDILRQRRWLQQHAADADLVQFQAVRDALDRARANLEHQLHQIAQARSGGA